MWYLAQLIPLGGGRPDNALPGIGGPVDPGYGVGIGGRPSHPIAPGTPPGIWGGAPAYPDQGLPVGRPPGIWGGAPAYPDQGLPGGGASAGQLPVFPDIGEPPATPDVTPGGAWVIVYWNGKLRWAWVGKEPSNPIAPTPEPKKA